MSLRDPNKPKEKLKPRSNGKHPGGRPPKFHPDDLRAITLAIKYGAPDAAVAEFCEVDEVTLYRWKAHYPEFRKAMERGAGLKDDNVERSLYRRAIGYTRPAVQIFAPRTPRGKAIVVPYTEQVEPSVPAAIFWLKNRRPQAWQDRTVHAGDATSPLIPPETDAKRVTVRNYFVQILNQEAANAAMGKVIEQLEAPALPVGKPNGKANGHG